MNSARYRKLELPDGPANVISFVDMPALIGQVVAGEQQRRQRGQNEACRNNMRQIEKLIEKLRRDAGRLPATFGELRRQPEGRERQVNDWCMMFGEQTKLLLDPKTGKVSCPAHGTVEKFRIAVRGEPRAPREHELIFSAFGVWALHIRVAGERVVADGRLVPAPQRRQRPRPEPGPRREGPAEF